VALKEIYLLKAMCEVLLKVLLNVEISHLKVYDLMVMSAGASSGEGFNGKKFYIADNYCHNVGICSAGRKRHVVAINIGIL
jgi:hypothetical protein